MTLTTMTFDGVPGGMNLAMPAQEIDDAQARYLQDILLDQPGLTRRRGPLSAISGVAALSRKASGIVAALDPLGEVRFAVLNGNSSDGYISIFDAALNTIFDVSWPYSFPTSPSTGASYVITDIKPALGGGAWIGTSSDYGADSPDQALARWFGGTNASSTSTVTATRGSVTVTGSGFNSNLSPGMFMFVNTDDPYSQAYVGVVKSIESDTSMTLSNPSPYNATSKSATFQAVRGFAPRVAKGELTTDTGSTAVTGGSTKFRSQKIDTGTILTGTTTSSSKTITGLSSTTGLVPGMPVTGTGIGSSARISTVDSSTQVTLTVNSTASASVSITFKVPWDLYRASDMTWIGTVLSVQSEVGLTLMANAAISLAGEAFVAIRADADFTLPTTGSSQKPGFLTANYADRQWYFNNGTDFSTTSRGWFSDASDPEIVDMSAFDGDWIDIVSTANVNEPVRGIQSAYNGMLIFKENETFIITGTSPDSFGVQKLDDDGALHNGSIQAYGGGCIWAGREGIHFYDGIQATNTTSETLGNFWKDTIRTFDPTTYRMWSMIARDHYFLFVENISSTVPVVKGNVSDTPSKFTICLNMITQAVTIMTNLDIRGSVVLPNTSGRSVWFIVNDDSKGNICEADTLFIDEGVDTITCDGSSAGPDFYMESKKYDVGDGLLLKSFRQLSLWYLAQGDALKADVVVGLNNIGAVLLSDYPVTGLTWDALASEVTTWDATADQFPTWSDVIESQFKAARVRFNKHSQFMAFRIYEASSSVTRAQVGPWQIGYKPMRPGRI